MWGQLPREPAQFCRSPERSRGGSRGVRSSAARPASPQLPAPHQTSKHPAAV